MCFRMSLILLLCLTNLMITLGLKEWAICPYFLQQYETLFNKQFITALNKIIHTFEELKQIEKLTKLKP